MDFLKKNKLVVGVIALIVVVLGGFLAFTTLSKNSNPISGGDQSENINVKKVSPEEIGLTLALKPDNKAITLKITKLDGIKSIDYELDYNALVTDEGETNDVPRGVLSTIDVNPDDSELTKEILLGTCSSGTCKYDKVTSDIKLILKINYTNGEVGSVETSIPFKSEE